MPSSPQAVNTPLLNSTPSDRFSCLKQHSTHSSRSSSLHFAKVAAPPTVFTALKKKTALETAVNNLYNSGVRTVTLEDDTSDYSTNYPHLVSGISNRLGYLQNRELFPGIANTTWQRKDFKRLHIHLVDKDWTLDSHGKPYPNGEAPVPPNTIAVVQPIPGKDEVNIYFHPSAYAWGSNKTADKAYMDHELGHALFYLKNRPVADALDRMNRHQYFPLPITSKANGWFDPLVRSMVKKAFGSEDALEKKGYAPFRVVHEILADTYAKLLEGKEVEDDLKTFYQQWMTQDLKTIQQHYLKPAVIEFTKEHQEKLPTWQKKLNETGRWLCNHL